MDYVTGLPKVQSGYDAILVVVDRFTKSHHFIAAHTSDTADDAAGHVFRHVVCRHGLPSVITTDRGAVFTAAVWTSLWKRLGTYLNVASTDHP